MAAAKEISVGAAIAVVLSGLGGIFTLKETQKTTVGVFLGEHVSALLPTGLGKSLAQHCSAQWLATRWRQEANVATRTNRKP